MKTYLNYAFVLLAGLAVALSCSKIGAVDTDENGEAAPSSGKQIIIHATLPDAPTRVVYTLDESGEKPKLTLKWESSDALLVSNASGSVEIGNPTIDATGKKATFSGTLPEGGEPYTVVVKHANSNLGSTQTQAADGDLKHLEYAAMAESVTEADFENLTLTQTTGVLGLIAKLPTAVSASVKAVIFQTENNLFNGSNTLTVNLTQGGAGVDNILYVYANVAASSIPAGTEMFIRFKVGDGEKDYYTRYQKFDGAVSLTTGALNGLKLNCSHIDRYAGKDDNGTEAAPYLIADGHQLAAVNEQAVGGSTTFFKLIDDVDMTGISHNHINTNNGYTQVVNFDGNSKTISNLSKDLFYVLKGSVYNLTLDRSTVTARGILAEYIQGTDNVVENVTVSNGTIEASRNNAGGLVGTIDGSGTTATITNCFVSDTDVTGAGVVGGVIGFADALVTISGCTYSNGTVKATARYAGGLIASTSNYASIISDCHVKSATISFAADRSGGFAGLLHTKVQVKGCTVGTPTTPVIVESTQTTATANVGGFAGCNYGKITKSGDIRSYAFVTVSSSNVTVGNKMQIGGFVGYNTGTIEYSDASVTMTGMKGTHIGGFCGVILGHGTIQYCTEIGSVTGNNYTGGFVGGIDATATFKECTAAGSVNGASSIGGFAGGSSSAANSATFIGNSTSASVTSSGSNVGGFIGNAVGVFTSNHATGDVVSTGGGNCGGFAGGIWEKSTDSSFSKNYTTGNVSGKANLGGLIGYIGGNLTMSDCYATGNVGNSTLYNQKYGGLVGYTTDNAEYSTEIRITDCYATGDVEASFASAGLIGRIGLASCYVSSCVAWNAKVYPHSSESANWSSAAVVGVTFPTCTLTNNYRSPSMNLTAYWVPVDMATFQHADVSPTHPLTDSNGNEMGDTATASGQTHYPQYPYHGKVEAGKTLSQLASTTLGWSSDVWDFTGDLPTLK